MVKWERKHRNTLCVILLIVFTLLYVVKVYAEPTPHPTYYTWKFENISSSSIVYSNVRTVILCQKEDSCAHPKCVPTPCVCGSVEHKLVRIPYEVLTTVSGKTEVIYRKVIGVYESNPEAICDSLVERNKDGR